MTYSASRLSVPFLLVFALPACERMEPSGSPFEPVPVTAATSPTVQPSTPAAAEAGAEWDFAEQEAFVIESEEMGSDGDALADDSQDAVSNKDADAENETDGEAGDADANAAIAPQSPATVPTEATGEQADGWPLRLVSTVHQAQPPRAILGLPDGRELVVAPGDILADERLIILAIGDGIIQVAEIGANGDHAEIASRTLTAQY